MYKVPEGYKDLWMKVTSDEYELPVAVADSVGQLAKLCGVSVNTIYTSMSHAKHQYRGHKSTCYIRVRVEVDEDLM
jgi:hypothetical protein